MRVLMFRPIQAGYSVEPDDGISAIKLAGGSSRYEVVSHGNAGIVNVPWVLTGPQFDLMQGFRRVWLRSLEPFLIDLVIDMSTPDRYQAMFVPDSFRWTKSGPLFHVTAQLEVMPLDKYLDPETDPGEALVMLDGLYGAQAARVLRELEKLVNVDLPHA